MSSGLAIKSLLNTSFEVLYESFSKAFKDYEIQLNKDELIEMLQRRGFNAALSFGAFDNNELVAFTFNGIGNHNGIKTAYDTGTGTVKEHRGRGLATQIFEYSIPHLKEAGIKQYLLEVLQHNQAAISVYQKLDFKIEREFNYFVQKRDEVKLKPKKSSIDYVIQPIEFDSLMDYSHFCDFMPSWQNSLEAIKRRIDTFLLTGAFYNEKLVGYCVFEPNSGDITQIAINKEYRRSGIGTMLLKNAMSHNEHTHIKCTNTQLECSAITRFFAAQNMDESGKQFEMIRDL